MKKGNLVFEMAMNFNNQEFAVSLSFIIRNQLLIILDQTYSNTAHANERCYNMNQQHVQTIQQYTRTYLIYSRSTWCSQFRTRIVEQQTLEKPKGWTTVEVDKHVGHS